VDRVPSVLSFEGRCAPLLAIDGGAVSFFPAAKVHGWIPVAHGPIHVSSPKMPATRTA
jgi:hypothetical protein